MPHDELLLRAGARRPRLDGTGSRRSLTAVDDPTRPAVRSAAPVGSRVIDNLLSSSCIASSNALRCRTRRGRVAAPVPTARRKDRRDRTGARRPAALPPLAARRRRTPPSTAPAGRSGRRPDVVARARSSTRSTSAASPTPTATAPATSPASGPGSPTCATSASTPSGSRPGTSRRSPTAATTSPTTGPSIRRSARSRRPRRSSPRPSRSGIRTIIDIVPNHVSDQHPWFQAALAAGPGSPGARRGSGSAPAAARTATSRRPPGHRTSGGQTWTRTTNPDGTPGEWYLHLFTAEQPDLNWDHPDVRAEHEAILRFWFDRGAAGVRIDSAALLVKDPALPEVPADPAPGAHPLHDRDELHDIYRGWRAVADAYPGHARPRRRGLARRTSSGSPGTSGRTSCTRPSTSTSWPGRGTPPACARRSTRRSPRTPRSARPATWVLSNHDVTRPVTRYGREDSSFAFGRKRFGTPTDLELGRRRARAAALLTRGPARLAVPLPGRRARARRGRGPARRDPGPDARPLRRRRPGPRRLPRPAAVERRRRRRSGSARTAPTARPWLTQPAHWADLTVERAGRRPRLDAQPVPRRRCGIRRPEPGLGDGPLTWVRVRPGRPRLRARRSSSSASPTCPAPRCRCRPTGGPAGQRGRLGRSPSARRDGLAAPGP